MRTKLSLASLRRGGPLRLPLILLVLLMLLPLLAFTLVDWTLPVDLKPRPGSRVVLASDNSPLRAFADQEGLWRYPISIDQVSPLYLDALIHYEDRYFYRHPGVNPFSLLRAIGQAIRSGTIVSGGSTLTMQVARMRYPEPRTLIGKGKELVRALQLELHYSKAEILTYYLNQAPFGGTIEGVQAAALSYFGYGALELTHAQAALLAVLPQAPTRYRPDRNPAAATLARNKVIDRLVSYGVWSANDARQAKMETVTSLGLNAYQLAPLLARRLATTSSQALIQTPIIRSWQISTERLLKEQAKLLGDRVSMAALVMENATGYVRVYAGSADFADLQRFGHVDMVPALRSPGSTLKPFIYGLAIDAGLIHSESLLMDVPLRFGDYQPENFSGGFSGPVSVAQSLTRSLNVPAVQVLEQLGPVPFYLSLQQAGAELQLPPNGRPNLAIGLGGLGTSLESLVRLYSALDHSGATQTPRFTLDSPKLERPLLSPGSAWIIRKLLADAPNAPQGIAVKTGTSYGFRDSWAIGLVAGYTLGVWVGQPDGTPLTGHNGRQTAVPLLVTIAARLLGQNRLPERPYSVSSTEICWPTGQPEADDQCDEARPAWLLNQLAPATWMATVEHRVSLESSLQTMSLAVDSNLQVPFGCPVASATTVKTFWPLPLQPWLPSARRTHTRLVPFDPRCAKPTAATRAVPLAIAGIRAGDAIHVAEGQQPLLTLRAEGGQAPFYWYINGALQANHQDQLTLAPMAAHQYEIVLMDSFGQLDRQVLQAL